MGFNVVESSLLGLRADEPDLLLRVGKGHEAQLGVTLGVGQGQAAPAAPCKSKKLGLSLERHIKSLTIQNVSYNQKMK